MRVLVTGGAGFIGSALVRHLLARTAHEVVNLDLLTYAGNPDNLRGLEADTLYAFVRADIADPAAVTAAFARHDPDAVLHLAAESHVDRSIDGPARFVATNIVGTQVLLDAALRHWQGLAAGRRAAFRFHHVSTDEVFGPFEGEGAFTEDSPYRPSSPYAASKAGADMLVRAWHRTYGLPVVLSNSSNNYGPRQHPEKLVPTVILAALEGRPIPVYGDGRQVRDWLHVEDHAEALLTILGRGRIGETYLIGGRAEVENLDLVRLICARLDELLPESPHRPHLGLVRHVTDRPGHDRRYAVDGGKLERELGWRPAVALGDGVRRTVEWYLANRWWWQAVRARGFDGARLGLGAGGAGTVQG